MKSIIATYDASYILFHESAGVRNSAQLTIFIPRCDVNLKISEKLLETSLMLSTTTVADIFYSHMKILTDFSFILK